MKLSSCFVFGFLLAAMPALSMESVPDEGDDTSVSQGRVTRSGRSYAPGARVGQKRRRVAHGPEAAEAGATSGVAAPAPRPTLPFAAPSDVGSDASSVTELMEASEGAAPSASSRAQKRRRIEEGAGTTAAPRPQLSERRLKNMMRSFVRSFDLANDFDGEEREYFRNKLTAQINACSRALHEIQLKKQEKHRQASEKMSRMFGKPPRGMRRQRKSASAAAAAAAGTDAAPQKEAAPERRVRFAPSPEKQAAAAAATGSRIQPLIRQVPFYVDTKASVYLLNGKPLTKEEFYATPEGQELHKAFMGSTGEPVEATRRVTNFVGIGEIDLSEDPSAFNPHETADKIASDQRARKIMQKFDSQGLGPRFRRWLIKGGKFMAVHGRRNINKGTWIVTQKEGRVKATWVQSKRIVHKMKIMPSLGTQSQDSTGTASFPSASPDLVEHAARLARADGLDFSSDYEGEDAGGGGSGGAGGAGKGALASDEKAVDEAMDLDGATDEDSEGEDSAADSDDEELL